MKLACISFTSSGREISRKLKNESSHIIVEINKETFQEKVSNHMKEIFNNYDGIIFISSTGIALRLIAPYIECKTKDPAVIVVDDMGKYTISLLSGHIGGANELTLEVSKILGNQAIITTASDNRGIDAIDTFAKRYNLEIESMDDAKKLTSLMVEGKKIKLVSDIDVKLNYDNVIKNIIFSQVERPLYDGAIIISSIEDINDLIDEQDKCKPICILRPKNLNIGIGCRRGKSKEEILNAIKEVFEENNLSLKSISKIGTIDVKEDEEGIIETSKEFNCPMIIFTKEDIESIQQKFNESQFVKSKVGVTSVCEPCAYLLGSEMIVNKKIINGITIAVSRSDNIG